MTPEPDFDWIARPYRWLEYLTLGKLLQNCRTYYLSRLSGRKLALALGDGDGRFLAALLASDPGLHAVAIDTSSTMLKLLRQRCEAAAIGAATRLHTTQSSALKHTPAASTDLVTAHFFFDCLTQPELDALILRLAKHIRPDALWLVSDFRIPAGPLRVPARLIVRSLYLAFRLLTGLRTTHLPDHSMALTRAGLTRSAQHLSLCGLLTTEIWSRL